MYRFVTCILLKKHVSHSFCNYCTKVSHTQELQQFKEKLRSGPALSHFVKGITSSPTDAGNNIAVSDNNPYLPQDPQENSGRKVFIETYGCQMNVNDTEIINAILQKEGFEMTRSMYDSDVIFLMTCAIREGAEQKIWKRLQDFKHLKRLRSPLKPPLQIGILGCMAERLKHKIVEKEKLVDIVAGPDSYRDLPNLLSVASKGQKAVNVMLSADETYADILPVRTDPKSKTAFVSIMRGCENMCTYCIVPFTRGKERSRPMSSILDEIRHLSEQGYKEVTLLGQNVNSYRDLTGLDEFSVVTKRQDDELSKGFTTVYRQRIGGFRFSDLLQRAAEINPEMRIRYTAPHPKDFPDPVLQVIKEYPNICKVIHLPAQSGSSKMLSHMGRGHTREAYLELVDHIRDVIPGIAFTSDFICGFCDETEEDHLQTLSLIERVKYEFVYVFAYSMRNKTAAYHRLKDNVPVEVKNSRAFEVNEHFRRYTLELHQKEIGKEHLVLVSGPSKRSVDDWAGRNDKNTKVIFPYTDIPTDCGHGVKRKPVAGEYIVVKIEDCSSQVLKGKALYHTTLQAFFISQKEQALDIHENRLQ